MTPAIAPVVYCHADGLLRLEAYAWPGGYPIIYIDNQNEVLCASCATTMLNQSIYGDNETSYTLEGWDVFYEGPDMYCAACNTILESAYGNPEQESQEQS